MPRDSASTVIDGDRYEMTLLGATQGYRLFHRLFKMFGPSFGRLVDVMGQQGATIQDVDMASDAAVAALKALAVDVTEADLDRVIEALKKQTHVGVCESNKTIPLADIFELHFSGRIGPMFHWLAWGLKVQYQSFFDVFATMKPPDKGPVQSGADSQTA